jgi:hypothetical protein
MQYLHPLEFAAAAAGALASLRVTGYPLVRHTRCWEAERDLLDPLVEMPHLQQTAAAAVAATGAGTLPSVE